MNERKFEEYIPEEDKEYVRKRTRMERTAKALRIACMVAQIFAICMEKIALVTLTGILFIKVWGCPKVIYIIILAAMIAAEAITVTLTTWYWYDKEGI